MGESISARFLVQIKIEEGGKGAEKDDAETHHQERKRYQALGHGPQGGKAKVQALGDVLRIQLWEEAEKEIQGLVLLPES